MTSEIIVALITLVGTLVGTFSGIVVGTKLINYRIEQLEKKVDKHNQVVERVYRLEEHDTLVDEKIRVANHRIDDLENGKGQTKKS